MEHIAGSTYVAVKHKEGMLCLMERTGAYTHSWGHDRTQRGGIITEAVQILAVREEGLRRWKARARR